MHHHPLSRNVPRGACSMHQREGAPSERTKVKLGCSPQLLYTLDISAAAAAKKTSVELGFSGTSASVVDFRITPLVSGRGTPVTMFFCTDEMLDCQAVECAEQQSGRAMYGSTQLVYRLKHALFELRHCRTCSSEQAGDGRVGYLVIMSMHDSSQFSVQQNNATATHNSHANSRHLPSSAKRMPWRIPWPPPCPLAHW